LDQRIRIPFLVLDGGVEAGAFCLGLVILIPPEGFPTIFLTFLGGCGSTGVFFLQAGVLGVAALDLAGGSSEDSVLGSRVETGMAGIRTSSSNLGISEIKLSKSCIQEIRV
jgi:hypothetical protein